MSIFTLGLNHKTAPINVREQLAISPLDAPDLLTQLLQQPAVNEAVILSTCNRTEIYTHAHQTPPIMEFLNQHHQLELSPYCYQFQNDSSIKHLLRVASGLDSMVLGEPQILGQIKAAYHVACEAGAVGEQFKFLFPSIFASAKQIRHQTAIGHHAVTLAYAVITLAKRIFSRIEKCQVLMIGCGEIMELMALHLQNQHVTNLTIASRNLEKAHDLADQYQANAIRIGDIPQHINQADIVITATASQLPILGKGLLETTINTRKRRPLFIADLAIPRDVEPQVNELEDIYLYNIDDMQQIITENLKNREMAAKQAEALIDLQTQHYLRQRHVFNSRNIIAKFREHLATLSSQEFNKAKQHLQAGKDPLLVMQSFSHHLINKIMHQPTIKLRQAAYEEQFQLLQLTKKLFDL